MKGCCLIGKTICQAFGSRFSERSRERFRTIERTLSRHHKKRRDGRGEAEKIATHTHRITPYSLHPSEDLIALTSVDGQGNSDVVTKTISGDSTKGIIATKFREDTPRFSPDGNWFTYFSMDTGKP